MADLIDRQAAIDEAYAVIVDDAVYDVVQVETLEALPSVDAVEIIRCKDCKHYEEINQPYPQLFCRKHSIDTLDDDYCSYGERKDD